MINRFEQEEEELRRARIAKRRAQMRKEKERQIQLRKKMKFYASLLSGCVCFLILVMTIQAFFSKEQKSNTQKMNPIESSNGIKEVQNGDNNSLLENSSNGSTPGFQDGNPMEPPAMDAMTQPQNSGTEKVMVGDKEFWGGYETKSTDATKPMDAETIISSYGILVNASTGEIVANRNDTTRINPASMTKILTVLVAAEQIENLEEEVTITFEMTDYAYVNDCSVAGFEVDEKVPVKDLFYGTILPSGGEAAMALAIHTAGSEEAFMELMNKKLEELGLSDTAHFTNCVGLYGDNHYCTVSDMAMILKAALENDLCREVITSRTYQTTITEQHPEGLLLSNWFLRRIEDKDCGGQVLGAKTGFVNESGSCAASYGISAGGTPYICVTANAYSSWRCIYDHVEIYSAYAK